MARGACVAGTGRPWSLPSSDPSFIIKGVDSRQLAHATGVAASPPQPYAALPEVVEGGAL